MADHREVVANLDLIFENGGMLNFTAQYPFDPIDNTTPLGLFEFGILDVFPISLPALLNNYGPIESIDYTVQIVPLPGALILMAGALAFLALRSHFR